MIERGTHFHVTTEAGAREANLVLGVPEERIHVVKLGTPLVHHGPESDEAESRLLRHVHLGNRRCYPSQELCTFD